MFIYIYIYICVYVPGRVRKELPRPLRTWYFVLLLFRNITYMLFLTRTTILAFPLVGASNVGGCLCRCDPPYAHFVCV